MISLPIPGSSEAPRIARHAALAQLEGCVTKEGAQDIALLISELVTNSVVHAGVGGEDTVLVELAAAGDRLTITVTDHGSDLVPKIVPRDPTTPHGLGLHLVEALSDDWGFRSGAGTTQVWCELVLDDSQLLRPGSGVAALLI